MVLSAPCAYEAANHNQYTIQKAGDHSAHAPARHQSLLMYVGTQIFHCPALHGVYNRVKVPSITPTLPEDPHPQLRPSFEAELWRLIHA